MQDCYTAISAAYGHNLTLLHDYNQIEPEINSSAFDDLKFPLAHQGFSCVELH